MRKRRVVRFSLACLPLVVFSGLGVACQQKTLPTTATTEVSAQPINGQMQQLEQLVTEDELNNTNLNIPLTQEEGQLIQNVNVVEVTVEEALVVDVEAQERDAERVARTTQIRDALESYKTTNASYPNTLEVLVTSAYLGTIPTDLDGTDFSYTPIGALPAQYYDLCYALEVGVGTITSGYHCATPDGVAKF